MKLKIGRESDALYFRLTDAPIYESEDVRPGMILDLDEQGTVVGIEMLAISTRTQPDMLRMLHFETV